ncbi:hypothetical protein VNI00_001529 [Paramarasmius palmivorus]|uniref:N-alpha-acetyltransferase 40 n=1 Tax=Paramarasmius palmivorus TaxID=297713 RepID=A0AAW0E324_9AGAR
MHPEDDPSVIAGYAMFRFEYEDGFDLLYCYELQIQETYQKRGLGRFLMELLIAVGEKWRMHKVMLTVIKANKSAVKFYERTGFNVDPTSPSFGVPPEEDEEDYEILSQSIPISSGDKAPLPPGQKRVKEGWENIWYIGMFGSMAFAAVMLYYKPDTSVQTWALKEAKERMEARGEKYKYEPSTTTSQ